MAARINREILRPLTVQVRGGELSLSTSLFFI